MENIPLTHEEKVAATLKLVEDAEAEEAAIEKSIDTIASFVEYYVKLLELQRRQLDATRKSVTELVELYNDVLSGNL